MFFFKKHGIDLAGIHKLNRISTPQRPELLGWWDKKLWVVAPTTGQVNENLENMYKNMYIYNFTYNITCVDIFLFLLQLQIAFERPTPPALENTVKTMLWRNPHKIGNIYYERIFVLFDQATI